MFIVWLFFSFSIFKIFDYVVILMALKKLEQVYRNALSYSWPVIFISEIAVEARKVDRKVIAVIILAMVTIAMIAVFIASDSDAKDEKYTISQALRPGDYITYTYEMDGVEGIKEFRITGHDKETGTYSVDDRYVVFTYPKDGSITVKDYFENKTMTGQEITDVVLMTVDTFYKKLQTQVSLNEGVDLTFEKIGQETVDTENF